MREWTWNLEALVSMLIGNRVNYWLTFGIDLCAIPLIATVGLISPGVRLLPGLLAALVGWWIWTLFEYVVHRYVFHRFVSQASRVHLEHHRAPRALTGIPFFVPLMIACLWWFALSALLPRGYACLLVAGSYAGYAAYGAVHHASHLAPLRSRFLRRRQRLHMIHHARMQTNFGVTTSLWDRLFGTYAVDRRAV